MTLPKALVIRPSFLELLPRNACLASVHLYGRGVWPLPSSVEEFGLWKALGEQQPHKVLRRGGKRIRLLCMPLCWGGKSQGENGPREQQE